MKAIWSLKSFPMCNEHKFRILSTTILVISCKGGDLCPVSYLQLCKENGGEVTLT